VTGNLRLSRLLLVTGITVAGCASSGSQGSATTSSAVPPQQLELGHVHGLGVYESTDGGATWRLVLAGDR
jgi:hypothetical protein